MVEAVFDAPTLQRLRDEGALLDQAAVCELLLALPQAAPT